MNDTSKYHHCGEKCKGRKSGMSICFGCKEIFFIKCFGIDQQYLHRMNAPDSYIRLICGNCIINSKKRKSISTLAPSNVSTPISTSCKTTIGSITPVLNQPTSSGASIGDMNQLCSLNNNIMELLKEMRTPKIIDPQQQQQKPKNPSIVESNCNNECNKLDTILQLMIKHSDKLRDIHTLENEKQSLASITKLIEKKFGELSMNDMGNLPFDNSRMANWSVHH